MTNDLAKRLLSAKNMGMAIFDSGLTIAEIDSTAKRILEQSGSFSHTRNLLDFFPELVGSEDTISGVLKGSRPAFRLDYVNRLGVNDQLIYLNFLILAGDETGKGVLVLEDVSREAIFQREANQQNYDMLLLKQASEYSASRLGDTILGNSSPIRKIRDTIKQLSKVPGTTVLIMGESGTGKNLAAKTIHHHSFSARSPFIDINCGALPENLVEAELFGVEKGAYTHATESRKGLIESANGGTIFLDEIGELPLNLQAKLLSVLENKVIRRLGSCRNIKVDVKIIAATNRELFNEVKNKKFREDLFYRLNVVSLYMPPLRKLGEDILQIATHFLNIFNINFNKKIKGFTAAAQEAIIDYAWPGNVRELSNCIERAMIFAEQDFIDKDQLVFFKAPGDTNPQEWDIPEEGMVLEAVERQFIVSALAKAGNNKSKAARLLGLTRDTLRYRLEKYNIQ